MGDFRALARSAAGVATGGLGWPPERFWAATPAELQLALEGRFGAAAGAALGRRELAKLRESLGDG
ncbi:phage tail assembly chaperone [Sandaracinobacter sp. RS1-74]|uniref:phage tail assembly chaperone n=1 Tax=Sandaracinobacteroides sayramensis TaxID=2913411 RepID=UPI001EDB182A|nr:phage tail assembly chaperone [Sandaracinobacteroides sayramensis]MCG2839757.1 phage tail assembly chaperone [Sandaracinobacteroides sayramensis]